MSNNVIFVSNSPTVLEKKSKLRNLFEKQNSAICVPCYLDNARDLENIAKNELKKIIEESGLLNNEK